MDPVSKRALDESATHQQNQVEGTALTLPLLADKARVGLLLSKQLHMVGQMCHYRFKAPAVEAIFTMNHLCGQHLASAKPLHLCQL